ncbi:sodium:calcium antiporter [[Mycoplasma] mobile]|uniref:Ca2+/Na+ antiporter n=1 Tax=Mycoplasma mobile (strain ATCC 43663 / 163K / NCTC 11711) TaxID=267748 RepID=Q6KI24_MYCM1|nr:Ca2+/Na+ antiporter [[Mycoplasma] mobile]AAT27752.1 Ca2+/Na+ antiporter [Mycoplasma mobile 163K]
MNSTQQSIFPGINNLTSSPGIQFYIWFLFLLMAGILSFISLNLVKNAEIIIAKTKLGGAFVGGVLISAITSMPEFITAVSQAGFGNAETGISDDLGSNAFAIFLIMITGLLLYRDLFLVKVKGFTRVIILISLVSSLFYGIILLIGQDAIIGVVGQYAIGVIPAIFLIIYLISTYLQYKYGGDDEVHETVLKEKFKNKNVRKTFFWFIIWAILLCAASLGVNFIINGMQIVYGIDSNSAGGLILAITTSLPEIISFGFFMKNKQPIAAFGTLIGSAIFNNSLIFWADLAFRQNSIVIGQRGSDTFAIAFLVAGLLALLSLIIFFPKFFSKKRYYFIIPALGVISFVVGWSLIIAY